MKKATIELKGTTYHLEENDIVFVKDPEIGVFVGELTHVDTWFKHFTIKCSQFIPYYQGDTLNNYVEYEDGDPKEGNLVIFHYEEEDIELYVKHVTEEMMERA